MLRKTLITNEKAIDRLQIMAINGEKHYAIHILNEKGVSLVFVDNFPTKTPFGLLDQEYQILDGEDMPKWGEREEYITGINPIFCVMQTLIYSSSKVQIYHFSEDATLIIDNLSPEENKK